MKRKQTIQISLFVKSFELGEPPPPPPNQNTPSQIKREGRKVWRYKPMEICFFSHFLTPTLLWFCWYHHQWAIVLSVPSGKSCIITHLDSCLHTTCEAFVCPVACESLFVCNLCKLVYPNIFEQLFALLPVDLRSSFPSWNFDLPSLCIVSRALETSLRIPDALIFQNIISNVSTYLSAFFFLCFVYNFSLSVLIPCNISRTFPVEGPVGYVSCWSQLECVTVYVNKQTQSLRMLYPPHTARVCLGNNCWVNLVLFRISFAFDSMYFSDKK